MFNSAWRCSTCPSRDLGSSHSWLTRSFLSVVQIRPVGGAQWQINQLIFIFKALQHIYICLKAQVLVDRHCRITFYPAERWHLLSLTTPPFMKTKLRITNRRLVFGLAGLLCTHGYRWVAVGGEKHIWQQSRVSLNLPDGRFFLSHLYFVDQNVGVVLAVQFNQSETKHLERHGVMLGFRVFTVESIWTHLFKGACRPLHDLWVDVPIFLHHMFDDVWRKVIIKSIQMWLTHWI